MRAELRDIDFKFPGPLFPGPGEAWPGGGHEAHRFQRRLEDKRPAEVVNFPPATPGSQGPCSRCKSREDACTTLHLASRGRGGLGMSASFCHVLPSHILGSACEPGDALRFSQLSLLITRLQMLQSVLVGI